MNKVISHRLLILLLSGLLFCISYIFLESHSYNSLLEDILPWRANSYFVERFSYLIIPYCSVFSIFIMSEAYLLTKRSDPVSIKLFIFFPLIVSFITIGIFEILLFVFIFTNISSDNNWPLLIVAPMFGTPIVFLYGVLRVWLHKYSTKLNAFVAFVASVFSRYFRTILFILLFATFTNLLLATFDYVTAGEYGKFSDMSNVEQMTKSAIQKNDIRKCQYAISHDKKHPPYKFGMRIQSDISCYIDFFSRQLDEPSGNNFDTQVKELTKLCNFLDPKIFNYCPAAAAFVSVDLLASEMKKNMHGITFNTPDNQGVRFNSESIEFYISGHLVSDPNTAMDDLLNILRKKNFIGTDKWGNEFTYNLPRKSECFIDDSFFSKGFGLGAYLEIATSTKAHYGTINNNYTITIRGNSAWFACEKDNLYKIFNETILPFLRSK